MIYTANQVAREYNITRRRVYALAESRNIGIKLSGVWVFSEQEKELLRPGKQGRPRIIQDSEVVARLEDYHKCNQSDSDYNR